MQFLQYARPAEGHFASARSFTSRADAALLLLFLFSSSAECFRFSFDIEHGGGKRRKQSAFPPPRSAIPGVPCEARLVKRNQAKKAQQGRGPPVCTDVRDKPPATSLPLDASRCLDREARQARPLTTAAHALQYVPVTSCQRLECFCETAARYLDSSTLEATM